MSLLYIPPAAANLTGTTLPSNIVTSSLQTFGVLAGNLRFTDNTYDIGASGATRPRSLYLTSAIIQQGTDGIWYGGSTGNTQINAGGSGFFIANHAVSQYNLQITDAGAITIQPPPAFVAGDKYLVVSAGGAIHVSALGPAS